MQIAIKAAVSGTPEVDATPEGIDPMITSYFSLNPNDIQATDKTKLKDIEDYLKNSSEDEMQRMQILRDVRSRVGTPMIGQTQIDLIHKHMMLTRALKATEAEIKEIER